MTDKEDDKNLEEIADSGPEDEGLDELDALEGEADGEDDASDAQTHLETVYEPNIEQPYDAFRALRIVEALLFASAEPLTVEAIATRLPPEANIPELLETLRNQYANRGVNLFKSGETYLMRTAPDLGTSLRIEGTETRRLSRAAVETLAIIAYHQPVTRAEIEEIRGVALSKGTLDTLFEAGWIKPRGRKKVPGRPVMWVTTPAFLDHFGLESLDDLPGVEELKASGLLDARPMMYGATAHEDAALPEASPTVAVESSIDEGLPEPIEKDPSEAEGEGAAAGEDMPADADASGGDQDEDDLDEDDDEDDDDFDDDEDEDDEDDESDDDEGEDGEGEDEPVPFNNPAPKKDEEEEP
jgi:segregation and condensation protein B